jgi:hypothetical protein
MVKQRLSPYSIVLVFLIAPSWLLAQKSSQPFSLPAGASQTFVGEVAVPLSTGFARIQADAGSTAPDGFALFQYRPSGILISETTVPAMQLLTTQRFFVEIQGNVNTGVAIANPNPDPAVITFGFQDPVNRFRGQLVGTGTFTIPPNSQIARFLNEAPFNFPAPYFGLMSVQSSIPVAITALRGLINERSEFLMTNVLEGQPAPGAFGSVVTQPRVVAGYIPRFADGGGWNTEIVLENMNSSDAAFVTLDFMAASGQPIPVTLNGQTAPSFNFTIQRGDILRVATDGAGSDTRGGYVRLTGQAHSARFNGFALYNFRRSNVTVSTASLPMVQPGASFQLPVQESASPAQLQTGIAISSASPVASTVFLELINSSGIPTGMTSTIQLPPFGQLARFLREIPGFETVQPTFSGTIRVTASTTEGVTVTGIRGQVNPRSDFVMSSLLPANPANVAAEKVVPQVVQGGGYQTGVLILNGQPGTTSSGTVSIVPNGGNALSLLSTQ